MPPRDLAERLFDFACEVVTYCRELSKEPGTVRHIALQLSDAGTSAAANYEEAKAAYSRREFAAKNSVVLKELRELCAIFTTSMKKLHPVERHPT
jgi:four helix bundle protein